jgi:demethylmenaquinone methyltransferase/2-methoxy-6-polyprenyl-1,4-benzoquinol methylase
MLVKRSGREKEAYVEELFSSIAPRYDLLNSIISLNRHKRWRRFAVAQANLKEGDVVLDVASGTGDFAVELAKSVGESGIVAATDFCRPMAALGCRKVRTLGYRNIAFALANAESLPFPDDTFDCATIGFALRNVADVQATLIEMTRVVKPGGRVISLEISRPQSVFIKPFWKLYFYGLLPFIARVFKGKREPYEYLPNSVTHFHSREQLAKEMQIAGMEDIRIINLTLGVVCVHVGVKSKH